MSQDNQVVSARPALAQVMELAVEGGASDVLAHILDYQARDRENINSWIEGSLRAQLERVTEQRDAAWRELDAIHGRLQWLVTGQFPREEA